MLDDESSEEDQKIKLSLKILLIGDSQVGKTSLLLKYTEHIFPEEHIATIGVEYKDRFIIRDNYNIRLQIWDTAGQERFHSITKNIYRNAHGVLFVYDITNRESFNNIKNWIRDLQNVGNDVRAAILGNKLDLESNRVIKHEEIEEICREYNMPFLETSARENINVNEGFDLIVNELFKDKTQEQIVELFSRKNRSDLSISYFYKSRFSRYKVIFIFNYSFIS